MDIMFEKLLQNNLLHLSKTVKDEYPGVKNYWLIKDEEITNMRNGILQAYNQQGIKSYVPYKKKKQNKTVTFSRFVKENEIN
jgi:hypothetical protein